MGNVLLVEASESDVLLFAKGVREYSGRIALQFARSPTWALHELKHHRDSPSTTSPRLILLGMSNPPDDEFVLLRTLKHDPILRRIPLVVFAPRGGHDWLPPAQAAHANCAVVKPDEPERFVALVKTTLLLWLSVAQLPMLHAETRVHPTLATGGAPPPPDAADEPPCPA